MKNLALVALVAAFVLGLPIASPAQTTLFIEAYAPATNCGLNASGVVLTTTWWNGKQMAAKDSLTLSPVKSNSWQCTGNYTASVQWKDPNLGECRGYATAANSIPVTCNGNACTPSQPAGHYTVQWNNDACKN